MVKNTRHYRLNKDNCRKLIVDICYARQQGAECTVEFLDKESEDVYSDIMQRYTPIKTKKPNEL